MKFSNRRILTFPVIQPYGGVTPATLLQLLIDLSHEICRYRSEKFVTQKKNSRESMRQVSILYSFFEELKEKSLLPDSMGICLTELYVVFQKILYLLEDCTRVGSRVWILMNSTRISNEFRILIRTLAVVLDIIPLDLISISSEMKEMVNLIKMQARKAKIEPEIRDQTAMNDVLGILSDLNKKIVPDSKVLIRVLQYLQIQRWGDCNREVRFLEDEIYSRDLDLDSKESQLLCSLIGLMSYCRSVLFSVLEPEKQEGSTSKEEEEEITNFMNSEDIKCPISLDVMRDPVTISTGQTYDRSSILKWFKSGNLICPKTGEKLKSNEMIPNSTLSAVINKFFNQRSKLVIKMDRNRDLVSAHFAKNTVTLESIKILSEFLSKKIVDGTEEDKIKATYEIRLLTKYNLFNRDAIVGFGLIPRLLPLISSLNPSIQENSIAALLNLSKHEKGKSVIVQAGGLKPIIQVLRSGLKEESQQNAAAILFYLCSLDKYQKEIGEIDEAIRSLVELIENSSRCGRKKGIAALLGLVLYPGNREKALISGSIPCLLNILASEEEEEEDILNNSLAALSFLSGTQEGSQEILNESLSLPLLIKFLESPTSNGKRYSVSILISLCKNNGSKVIEVLSKKPSIMDSLYSLMTEGTPRTRRKARWLLRVLHDFLFHGGSGAIALEMRQ